MYLEMSEKRFYNGRLLSQSQIDKYREKKKIEMRKRRSDPIIHERIKEQQRNSYRNGGKDRQKKYFDFMKTERFFKWRAKLFKTHYNLEINENDLMNLWIKQNGLCDLTGRKLDKSAHLDHIIPLKRGGKTELNNLRWVCPDVNYAKRNLTDEEFIKLNEDVIRFLGERIRAVFTQDL